MLKIKHLIVVVFLTIASYGYAAEISKETTITFSVNVKAPVCKIDVPDEINFEERSLGELNRGVDKDFAITFKECSQRIPRPSLLFVGNNIDDSGHFITNKIGNGYATGIGIRLLFNGDYIDFSRELTLPEFDSDKHISLPFTAQLGLKGNEKVTSGEIDTNILLHLIYN
ncbi:fimbrial protein [Escherichia coli]|uniref:fimbrial protein n=1 Tax=Escherichia coli TaxID=562 RepID=UPI000B7CBDCE|nr:fimbrial protein [Escherichia coli]MCQ6906634.1 fimbrial protein [Escherichia coli]MCQ6936205.1 fimbrial protein [Escherichia coli]SRB32865.1 P pilus assembly protein, pilin FimA [Escherichia coli]HBV1362164.1 type 1 fimbrial protein [Escherichia coli]